MSGTTNSNNLGQRMSWFNSQLSDGEGEGNIVHNNFLAAISQMSVADSGEVLDELRQALQLTPPPPPSSSSSINPVRGRLPDTVLHLGEESPPSTSNTPSSSSDGVDETMGAMGTMGAMPNESSTPEDPGDLRTEIRRFRALMQNREVQGFVAVCLRVVPFLVILLAKLFIERFWSISAIISAQFLFIFADTQLVRSLQSNTRLPLFKAQLSTLLFLLIMSGIVGLADLTETLTFSPPLNGSVQPFSNFSSLFSTLFWVLITDFTAKMIDIQMKIMVSCVPLILVAQKRRRRILQCIEYSVQLYRFWLPVRPWMVYLRTPSAREVSTVVALANLLLTLSYIMLKFYFGIRPFRRWLCSCRYVCCLRTLGSAPNRMDMSNEPNCSICVGEYQTPIKLSCGHVFCEECIGTWLDKEHTCPMCRKKVAQEDNEWKCGSTALMPQLF